MLSSRRRRTRRHRNVAVNEVARAATVTDVTLTANTEDNCRISENNSSNTEVTTSTVAKRRKAPTSRSKTTTTAAKPSWSTLLLLFVVVIVSLTSVHVNKVQVNAQSLANSFFTEPDVHPGFVSRVGPRALRLLADYLRQRVTKFMRFGALRYNASSTLTPLVRFTLTSTSTLHFDSTALQSQFNPMPGRGVQWMGYNFRMTINSIYKLQSSSGEVTGQVPVTFDKTSVEIDLASAVNADGHLKTDAEQCRVNVGELRMEFTPADAELLRNYLPLIHRSIREQLDGLLCPTFHAELVPVIANRLLNSPMSAALFDHYFINYGLIGPILYSSSAGGDPSSSVGGGIELRHRGNVFGILRQGRTRLNDFRLPFRSAPLAVTREPPKHMVTFQFSNYTVASLLFWMDQYRKFDYEISKTSVNDTNIAGYLRTECDSKDICAGTLFPALAQSFSNGVVSIKTHTVTFPHVRLENGKAFVVVDSRIDAFVTQPDRNRRFLTASMLAELSLSKAVFRDYTLKAELAIDTFKISDVVSLVDGIDAGSIEFLINALNELIIADDMAKKLKDGIRLPILFDFEQAGPAEIHFEKDRIWIGADYCFEDNCKRAAVAGGRGATASGSGATSGNGTSKVGQNNDMDANYYDTVN